MGYFRMAKCLLCLGAASLHAKVKLLHAFAQCALSSNVPVLAAKTAHLPRAYLFSVPLLPPRNDRRRGLPLTDRIMTR